ncbi:hypothetical protein EVA_19478 [gut metagenome]|uniref:Uncharacterized protein n=1 Tax=gut metagenome TaxID=749906 RepID=J9FS64_9ZZZZ
MLPETQMQACLQQLTRQGGFATKAVHRPLGGRTELTPQVQQAVEGTNDMKRNGQTVLLCPT